LFLVVALIFGTTTLAPVDSPLSTAGEAHAHTWQEAGGVSPHDWCVYTAQYFGFFTGLDGYYYVASRMIHYGAPHVYQCHLRAYQNIYPYNYVCIQQIEWYGWGDLNWWYPERGGGWCPTMGV